MKQDRINVVAIDGPAGSGKSTVAKLVAKELGCLYIDTGAMYRALTLGALERNIDIKDNNALIGLSGELDIRLESGKSSLKVYLDGMDVSEKIRMLDVSKSVKFIAAIKEVRENMVNLQRALAQKEGNAVLEGRDIGTVVFPDAKYKFYMDASLEERVKRRYEEFQSKNIPVSADDVESDVRERDESDKTRSVAPLKKAKDAVYIDTTNLGIEEVVKKVLSSIKK